MYSRCISCSGALGKNEILEHFPVGRRLAFDALKGRLWVLCTSCRTWNLAPLEERWEAVEMAERLFERAAIGASTENVALGRVAGGTELLRIGKVKRPELAFWRYGDRLVSRWRGFIRRELVYIGAGAALLGPAPIGVATSVIAGMAGLQMLGNRRTVMSAADGARVRRGDAYSALLLPTDQGWKLLIPRRGDDSLELVGSQGLRALRRLLPQVNLRGGRAEQVRNTVEEVERLGSSERVLREASIELGEMDNMARRPVWPRAVPGRIATAHPVIQLALEMAVNEEEERRALEGEMEQLQREWQEAEELASIADELLLPDSVRAKIDRWRHRAVDSG